MSKELLKQAADRIEELEKALEGKSTECVQLAESIKSEKTASEKEAADADKVHAEHVAVAKVAADKLLHNGGLSTQEKADTWAALVSGSHAQSLKALSKLAELLPSAPRVGQLVVSTEQPKTANETWDERINKYLK
jgi:hypothetical protein